MRLGNFRFTDWSLGTHNNTTVDGDGNLVLLEGSLEGYWEQELDLLEGCGSSTKAFSRLHPSLLYMYDGQASTAGDSVTEAVDALRHGKIIIVDCPEDPSDEDSDDVQICRSLTEGDTYLFLAIEPGAFGDVASELPDFLDNVLTYIAPYGIFLRGWGSEDGISSTTLSFAASCILERLMYRMYSGTTPGDFTLVATANDYFLLDSFFASEDVEETLALLEEVGNNLACRIVGFSRGLELLPSWTMATICGLSYWGLDESLSPGQLPQIYCGYEWEDSPQSSGEVPSRSSDCGILSWDYRRYPVFEDHSLQVDMTRLHAWDGQGYPNASVGLEVYEKDESGLFVSAHDATTHLPYFCGAEYENMRREIKLRIILGTDNVNISPQVSYADIQVRYRSGLIASFFSATERIINKFPRWMDMRELDSPRDVLPQSMGARFLNFIAGESTSHQWAKYYWDQAQKNPDLVDLNQKAWAWRVPRAFADLYSLSAVDEYDNNISPIITCSTEEFLASYDWEDTCLFSENGNLYFNRYYVTVTVNGEEYELSDMHIWNTLDSWGLLLDLPRLRQESNIHYKRRIEEVMVDMPVATTEGIPLALMRELSLADPPAMFASSPELWGATPEDWDEVFGATPYFGATPVIIELHKLGPGDLEWFDEQGFPTQELLDWVRGINARAGVTWDTMKSNKVTWDIAGEEGEALGIIPFRYDLNIWPATPEGSTPWWDEYATPPDPFYYNMWGWGVGDFNDLFVAPPLPPQGNIPFTLTVYVDGMEAQGAVFYPAVQMGWRARGRGRIGVFDSDYQDYGFTIFATEAGEPDEDPRNWEYYATISGSTIYIPETIYHDPTSEPDPVPDNVNLVEEPLMSHTGSTGREFAVGIDWYENGGTTPASVDPADVTAFSLVGGEWDGTAFGGGSCNANVDGWWTTDPESVTHTTTNFLDLIPPLIGRIGIAVNSDGIGSFLDTAEWYTDWQCTPPDGIVSWGPHALTGEVIVNGASVSPGSKDVIVPAPYFRFHPNCTGFPAYSGNKLWEVDISTKDDEGDDIGYTTGADGAPTTTSHASVELDDVDSQYIEDTSAATFSSSYHLEQKKSSLWSSGSNYQVEGSLQVPEVWSRMLQLDNDDFGITENLSPKRFRVISDDERIVGWMSSDNAEDLAEEPITRYLYAQAKDYSSLEWNPRIHSGYFYTPYSERYLYADMRVETFTALDPEDHSVILSTLPAQGAPIIVMDSNGTFWRKITSWTFSGDVPTLTNIISEECVGTGSERLYTAYRLIKNITVIDLDTEEIFVQGADFTIEENVITFYSLTTDRNHTYEINYTPQYSFYVDTENVSGAEQKAKVFFSDTLEEMEIDSLTVYYEGSTNPYYTEDTIRLSPLLTYWQKSFIFMQTTSQSLFDIEISVDPGQVMGDGMAWCTLHMVTLDQNENPIPGCTVMLSCEGGSFVGGHTNITVSSNEEGYVSTIWNSPDLSSQPGDLQCIITATYYRYGTTPMETQAIVEALKPTDPPYHIDVGACQGRAIAPGEEATQIIEITVLDEDKEPASGISVTRSMWTTENYTPAIAVAGTTDSDGKLQDVIETGDAPRQVFCRYYLTLTPTVMDTISWREYEIHNYPVIS